MIPCKENKCLLLPICKSKTIILCSELNSYYNYLRRDYYRRLDEWRKGDDVPNVDSHKVTDHLPKVIAIKEDHDTKLDDYKFVVRYRRKKV